MHVETTNGRPRDRAGGSSCPESASSGDDVPPRSRRAGESRPDGAAGKALVLNASMEPLCVVGARRAVVMVLREKADVIHANGHRFRSERLELASPSVVRLRRYVHVPRRRYASLTRRGVFLRDEHTCQYCGAKAENVDHVLPRSRGGDHAWGNVVAACRRCNSHKKDRTPAEAGMGLRRRPFAPRPTFWLVVAVGRADPEWARYLGDVLGAAPETACS